MATTGQSRLDLYKQNSKTDDVKLTGGDMGVVVGYFVVIVCIGIFAMVRSNRSTLGGYFLAGKSMIFLPIGASLFVSNIGTEHFIGLSGSGAASGISVGAWEFNAILLLQLLGWIFIPVYLACGTYTMPEYLTKRFGGTRLRVYFAVLSLILYIFTKCSGDLYTGALFIQQSLRWNLYLCIFILVIITGLLTMTGGLTAVIYTDTMQATLMVSGGLLLMGMSFTEVGGYDGLVRKYPNSSTQEMYRIPNKTCHEADENAFRMLREANDDYMPWPGFLLGQTPGSIWYWCADQVIVQRLLAAKSLSHAQGATLMAGFIKILPLFMMTMPGMISRILYPDEVACVDPDICNYVCQSSAGCSSIAYPRLVLGLMPDGLRGLMMAVMIAALMSDLDSIFNSASTLFTVDIYQRVRKNCSQKELMIVGRIFILVMVGVSIAWVPVVKEMQGGQVFIYIQEITNYLAPPFAAVFLLAVLVPRVNEQGAFWSLMLAFVTGVTRMVLAFIYNDSGGCGEEDPRPAIIKNFHYMYFALFIILLTNEIAGAFWSLMLAFVTGVTRMVLAFVYNDSGGCGEEDPRPAIIKNFHYMYFALFITLLTNGAFWSLMLAFVTGVTRMVLAFVYNDSGGCGEEDPRPAIIKNFHYMYFALFITLLTATAAIIISLLTEKPHEKYLARTTYWTRHSDPWVEENEKDKGEGFTNIAATGDDNKQVFSIEEKKVYRDPYMNPNNQNDVDGDESCGRKTYNYICGFNNKHDAEAERKMAEHMERVASLQQNPAAKIVLNIGLVLILSIGVFLYFFWSFWKYDPDN